MGAQTSRGYGESCPVAHALDLIGDRWALLVIRELRLGPRRFADLQAALPAIGPTMLSTRLRELAAVGVLARAGDSARVARYALTDWGAELEPVFGALARWGAASPVVPLRGPISDDAVMLGVRTFAAGAIPVRPAPDPQAGIDVRLTGDEYRLQLQDGRLGSLWRRSAGDGVGPSDADLSTDAATIQALLVGRSSVTAAVPRVTMTGDRRTARWLLGFLTPRGRRAVAPAPE